MSEAIESINQINSNEDIQTTRYHRFHVNSWQSTTARFHHILTLFM